MTQVLFAFRHPDGKPLAGAGFTIQMRRPGMIPGGGGVIVPDTMTFVTGEDGTVIAELQPSTSVYLLVLAEGPDSCSGIRYKFYVPDSDAVIDAEDLYLAPPPKSEPWDETAIQMLTDAKVAAIAAAAEAGLSADAAELSAAEAAASAEAAAAVVEGVDLNADRAERARDASEAFAIEALASRVGTNEDRLAAQQSALDAANAARVEIDKLAAPDGATKVGAVHADGTPGTVQQVLDATLLFKRSSLGSAIDTVNKMLSSLAYHIYEFAGYVVNKPDPLNADTWDWTPAIARAFQDIPIGGELVFTPGKYQSSGATREGALKIFAAGTVVIIQTANTAAITMRGRLGAIVPVVSAVATTYDFSGGAAVTTPVTKLTLATLPVWAVGDVIKVVADNSLPGGANPEQRAGEFAVVSAVVGNDVYLSNVLRDTFTTNVRARLQMDDLLGAYGLTFDTLASGNALNWSAELFSVVHGLNCEFENLTANFGYGIFMHLQSIYRYKATGITVRRLINDPSTLRYGYGISDKCSAFGIVSQSHFMGCRHGFTTGTPRVATAGSSDTHRYGRTYATKVTGCTGNGTTNAPFDAHELADAIEFNNCTASGVIRGNDSSGAGFQIRGRNVVLIGCMVQQARVGYSFISNYANETSNVTLIDCGSRDISTQVFINSGAAGRTIDKITIRGGSFESRTGASLNWIDLFILENPTFIMPRNSANYMKLLAFGRGAVTGDVTFDLSAADPTLTNIRCWNITDAATDIDIDRMKIIGAPLSVPSQAICEGAAIDPANKVTFRNVAVDRPTEGSKSSQASIAYRTVNNKAGTSSNSLTRVLTASGQFILTGTLYGDLTLKLSGGPFTLGIPDAGKHEGQQMRIINAGTAILTLPLGATVNLTEPKTIPPKSGIVLVWDGNIWMLC